MSAPSPATQQPQASNRSQPDRFFVWLALSVLLCGLVYVSQHWSPSSYGVFLNQIGRAGDGLVFGEPRPIRSDEWAVVTPFTQATVNNGFERYNQTSLYKEDLRINYGLPIFDWGLIFKPSYWGFLFLEPARAFSLHWFAMLALFIVGHFLLFTRIGLSRAASLLLSVGLYFTPFTQFWWNEKGPIMAMFPWVILPLLTQWRRPVQLLLFYWLGASWLITNFYPPLFVSLAFVGAVILLAFGREWFRPARLIPLALSAAAAGLTAAFYLKDYLLATAQTIYPGSRTSSGGAVPWHEWLATLLPFSNFDWQYQTLRGANTSEIGMAGAAFLLVALCCLKYERLGALFARSSSLRTPLLFMIGGLLLMTAWMALPLPSWVGAPLLWNHVQPERMEYAFGLLLMLFAALLIEKAGLTLSLPRLLLYVCLVLLGWVALKAWNVPSNSSHETWLSHAADLVVLPALLLAFLAAKVWQWKPGTLVLSASALSGGLVLFGFNPIQSAQVIFEPPNEATRLRLQAERTQGGTGPVALHMPGATLNGLGFASVTHVTPVPALAFWRERYSHLSEDEFLKIFSRYSHIQLRSDIEHPRSDHPDNVAIPLADFWPDRLYVPALAQQANVPPQWLMHGQTLSWEILAPRTAPLTRVAVLIGTGAGAADGQLHLKICTNHQCSEGQASLSHAGDNAYIGMPLASALPVEANQKLSLTLSAIGGKNGPALWLHEDKRPDQAQPSPLSPRWRLDFAPTPQAHAQAPDSP